jgi:hypothetical protein
LTPDEYFRDCRLGAEVHAAVTRALEPCGAFEVRTTKSQVAYRRRRGFAYLWLPGMYLSHPDAEVVLTITLDHQEDAARFKEIAHPAAAVWQHHLEIHDAADIDDEVVAWLRDAYRGAG